MKVEMRFWMETEEDDEPLTDEQWDKELEDIVRSVSHFINREHSTYVKNTDGECATEHEGVFVFVCKPKVETPNNNNNKVQESNGQ